MTTPPARRRVAGVAVVAALAVIGTACAGGQSVSVSTGEAPTAVIEDRAVAERAVLQAVDLPGFEVATPTAVDNSSHQAATSFESCAGASTALGRAEQVAQSPGFFKGKTVLVSSLAVVAVDEAHARRALAELSRGEAAACMTGLFRSVLSLDQLPGTSAATEALPPAKAGDQSAGWRTTVQVTSADATVSAYSDITFVRSGRTLGVLFDFQVGEPFAAAERARLVKALVQRMAAG